jgi:hypothetical protein
MTWGQILLTSFFGIFNKVCWQWETNHTLLLFSPKKIGENKSNISLYKQ